MYDSFVAMSERRNLLRKAISSPVHQSSNHGSPIGSMASSTMTSMSTTPNTPKSLPVPNKRTQNTVTVPVRDLKTLIEKTNNIDSYIKELREKASEESCVSSSTYRRRLPRELSVSIHVCFTYYECMYMYDNRHSCMRYISSYKRLKLIGILMSSIS